jgi:hypothetical protein
MAMRRSFASIDRRNRKELVMPRFKIDEKNKLGRRQERRRSLAL